MKRYQNIIKYIPFVNIICVFQLLVCLWKNSFYIHAKEKYIALFRPMLVLLGINIPVIIARSYLTNATVVYIVNILDAVISLYGPSYAYESKNALKKFVNSAKTAKHCYDGGEKRIYEQHIKACNQIAFSFHHRT